MRNHWPARLVRSVSHAVPTLALVMWFPHVARAQSAARPKAIGIVATDYAFAAPDTVTAGPSAFQFENHGAKRHEIAVVLARRGTTAAQIVAAAKAGLPAPRLSEAYGDGEPLGALFVAPGGKSRAALVTSLERGRVYVIVCTLRDSPAMPEHAELGMFHVIHVR
jgi:hypothetical protein